MDSHWWFQLCAVWFIERIPGTTVLTWGGRGRSEDTVGGCCSDQVRKRHGGFEWWSRGGGDWIFDGFHVSQQDFFSELNERYKRNQGWLKDFGLGRTDLPSDEMERNRFGWRKLGFTIIWKLKCVFRIPSTEVEYAVGASGVPGEIWSRDTDLEMAKVLEWV